MVIYILLQINIVFVHVSITKYCKQYLNGIPIEVTTGNTRHSSFKNNISITFSVVVFFISILAAGIVSHPCLQMGSGHLLNIVLQNQIIIDGFSINLGVVSEFLEIARH